MPDYAGFPIAEAAPSFDSTTATVPASPSGTNSLYASLAQQMQSGPIPSQTVATSSARDPRMPQNVQGTQIPQQRPMNNQATSITQARRQNAMASLTNAITGAVAKHENKKIDNDKQIILKVMQSNKAMTDAQNVLNTPGISDADKATAKKVLADNTKQRDEILNDPKHSKMIQKAFDVSYLDPEKNKTPQIQAMQAATQDMKKAGQYNADNPEEAKVAALANGEQKPVTPMNQLNPGQPAPAQASGQISMAQAQPQRAPVAQQPAQPAAPTRGEQFSAQVNSSGIAANPQYAAYIEREQKKQDMYYKNVFPAVYKAAAAEENSKFVQEQSNARAEATRLNAKAIADERSGDTAAANKSREKVAQIHAGEMDRANATRRNTLLTLAGFDPKTGLPRDTTPGAMTDKQRMQTQAALTAQSGIVKRFQSTDVALKTQLAGLVSNGKGNSDEANNARAALQKNQTLLTEATSDMENIRQKLNPVTAPVNPAAQAVPQPQPTAQKTTSAPASVQASFSSLGGKYSTGEQYGKQFDAPANNAGLSANASRPVGAAASDAPAAINSAEQRSADQRLINRFDKLFGPLPDEGGSDDSESDDSSQ